MGVYPCSSFCFSYFDSKSELHPPTGAHPPSSFADAFQGSETGSRKRSNPWTFFVRGYSGFALRGTPPAAGAAGAPPCTPRQPSRQQSWQPCCSPPAQGTAVAHRGDAVPHPQAARQRSWHASSFPVVARRGLVMPYPAAWPPAKLAPMLLPPALSRASMRLDGCAGTANGAFESTRCVPAL